MKLLKFLKRVNWLFLIGCLAGGFISFWLAILALDLGVHILRALDWIK